MDKPKYKNVIHACSLKDLELLLHGDQTISGDKGTNLSGGQKQRDADIYLLDEPFSAVDAHAGSELFKEYILTALPSKTVILVTHHVEFLASAGLILLSNGHAIQAGTDFNALVSAHHEAIEVMDIHEGSLEDSVEGLLRKAPSLVEKIGVQHQQRRRHEQGNPRKGSSSEGDKGEEEAQKLCVPVRHGSRALCSFRAVLVATFGLAAAHKLFLKMLRGIFRAPMSFFYSTPSGRILNGISHLQHEIK
ncbi:unnamed protein product [Spirodela intermedia]|uniref:Uncharacterized protein n=1 Tax=Spirodela intermedia TaxID=51605 RepID=A0A7I8JNF0_SPIIN|nr:unnamed protein product [Spirodela intermedia]CAA6671694.1 unnamed protein product [Spirodela intermedia]